MSRDRPDAVVLGCICNALMLRALSCEDVAEVGGLHLKTATRHVHALYTADPKLVHVGEWGLDTRGFFTIRRYRWGNLPDVPRPRQVTTSTERVRRLRARKKLKETT